MDAPCIWTTLKDGRSGIREDGETQGTRKLCQEEIYQKVQDFQGRSLQEDPLPVLQHNYDEVNRAYKEAESAHEACTVFLSVTGAEDKVLAEEDQYVIDLERKKKECHILQTKNLDQLSNVNNVSG